MSALYWLVGLIILAGAFVVVGLRDLVSFFQTGPGKKSRWGNYLIAGVWLVGAAVIIYRWPPLRMDSISDPFWTKLLGFSLAMLVLLGMFGPLRRRGAGRVAALAGQTFQEAMSQRAWLAVPLWLIGVLVVGVFISPYRLVQDRMMLTVELLVRGQLLVAGVLTLTLACRSIPRELDKKTIVVTASKPISMLELAAGKLLGFLVLGAFLVGLMGVLSYGILWYNGRQVWLAAQQELAVQQAKYESGERELPADADLRDIAQNGVLYARDPVQPVGPVGFNGKFDPNFDLLPCLKGGTFSRIQWRFDDIPVVDRLPGLLLNFGVERLPEEIPQLEKFDPAKPLTLKLEAVGVRSPRGSQAKKDLVIPIPEWAQSAGLSQPVIFPIRYLLIMDPAEWEQLFNVGPVYISVSFPVDGHNLYFVNESAELVNLSADVPGAGPEQGRMLASASGQARLVAKSFRNAWEISGTAKGQPEVAYWHFKDVDLGGFPAGDYVSFEMQPYAEKSDAVKYHTPGLVRVVAVKPDGSKIFWPGLNESPSSQEEGQAPQKVIEQSQQRDWPGWYKVIMQERRPTMVSLPKSLFSKDADVYVFLACGLNDGWISVGSSSGYLARNRRSFALNVLRCEAVVFMQVAAIAAVGVMSSSFLSWPVAGFLSMVLYLIGSIRPYLQELPQFWGKATESLRNYALELVAGLLPDFSAYKATAHIAQGEIISGVKLMGLFNQTTICILGLLVVGYLCLRGRELAK